MNRQRFHEITGRYSDLKIAIAGDFCLDRYFEIDPDLAEVSIETDLVVHNVTRVRTQPGAAGTILNNLAALGIGAIVPIGFCGADGEGWLLERALQERKNVSLDHFLSTEERKTFTYSKPLVMEANGVPRELNRLDQKNWTPTPQSVSDRLVASIESVAEELDALIVMDQVDQPETGVITKRVLTCLGSIAERYPELPILADSRQGLTEYPPLSFKMNANELGLMLNRDRELSLAEVSIEVERLATKHRRPVFVTLAEQGVVGAGPGEAMVHEKSIPVRGEIDIVGAGDSVTANLAAALAANATIGESLKISMAAASLVVHQLGTTGTASCGEIENLLMEA